MKAKTIIDEIEAVGKGLSILNPVPHSNEPRAASEGYDISAMLDGYENEGRKILKAEGYPLTVDEIMDSRVDEDKMPLGKKPLPRRVRDVMDMLLYFDMVRVNIKKKDISFSLCFMAYGVQSAMKARIRPMERFFDMGASLSRKERARREKRKSWNGKTHEEILERNQRIIKDFLEPRKAHLSMAGFAQKYAAKYGRSPRSIRLILSKAVGSLPR